MEGRWHDDEEMESSVHLSHSKHFSTSHHLVASAEISFLVGLGRRLAEGLAAKCRPRLIDFRLSTFDAESRSLLSWSSKSTPCQKYKSCHDRFYTFMKWTPSQRDSMQILLPASLSFLSECRALGKQINEPDTCPARRASRAEWELLRLWTIYFSKATLLQSKICAFGNKKSQVNLEDSISIIDRRANVIFHPIPSHTKYVD